MNKTAKNTELCRNFSCQTYINFKYFGECSAANQGSVQNTANVDLSKTILWNNKAIFV